MPAGKNIYFVVDDGAFESTTLSHGNKIIDTWNFTRGPITTTAFSPSDGATTQSVSTNIAIYFSENISKGSGNITLRAGSASGTVRQTIDVTSGAVSVSGTQATINPPSDLQYSEDTYVVVDQGCFTNTDGDADSGNAAINGYNFTTEAELSLGDAHEGGILICCSSGNYWIVASSSAEVSRDWHNRNDAVTKAQQVSGCSGWFLPSCSQLKNPGYQCRTYWDSYGNAYFWSNTQYNSNTAWALYMPNQHMADGAKQYINCIRAFRCVSY